MLVRWPRPSFYVVISLVIALDQLTKMWASQSLRPLGSVTLVPGLFNLTYVRNTGIAFGMFAHQGSAGGPVRRHPGPGRFLYTRSLNWAGWNRTWWADAWWAARSAIYWIVRDWATWSISFDAYLGAHHWPVFNVADSLICLSVGWIVLRQLKERPRIGVKRRLTLLLQERLEQPLLLGAVEGFVRSNGSVLHQLHQGIVHEPHAQLFPHPG